MTLNKKYNEAMNEITLSDDAKNRILEGVLKADLTPVQKRTGFRYWKQILAFSFVFVFGIALIPAFRMGRGGNAADAAPAAAAGAMPEAAEEKSMEAPSEALFAAEQASDSLYRTLADIENECGFAVREPAVPFEVTGTDYTYQDQEVRIVYYGNGCELVYCISEMVPETAQDSSNSDIAFTASGESQIRSLTDIDGRYVTLEIKGTAEPPEWEEITAPLTGN